MPQMGSTTQSLRDKHYKREGRIKKPRSRDNAVQRTIKDAQTVVQDAQEEPPNNAQHVVDIQKESRSSKKKSRVLKTQTKDERRASEAGSVQQGSANSSCCGGASAGMQTVFEDLCNRRTQFPPGTFRHLQSSSAQLERSVCAAQCRGRQIRGKPEAGGQPTGPAAAEGRHQVPPTDWQGKHSEAEMDMMLMVLMPTGRQRSPPSPTKEADPDRQHQWPEEEPRRTEVRRKEKGKG